MKIRYNNLYANSCTSHASLFTFRRGTSILEANIRNVNDWRSVIQHVLDSKVEELRLLGYEKANSEEVWQCLLQKVWRKNNEKRLHEVVQDILHLSGNQYMSFLTVEMHQQNEDLMAQIEALKQWEERH